MSGASPNSLVVQMIWTRQLDGRPMAGRLRVAHAIRQVLRDAATVRECVMTPSLDGRLTGLLSALAAVLT